MPLAVGTPSKRQAPASTGSGRMTLGLVSFFLVVSYVLAELAVQDKPYLRNYLLTTQALNKPQEKTTSGAGRRWGYRGFWGESCLPEISWEVEVGLLAMGEEISWHSS